MGTLSFLDSLRCSSEELKVSFLRDGEMEKESWMTLLLSLGKWNTEREPCTTRLCEALEGTALAQWCISECWNFIWDNCKLSQLKCRCAGNNLLHLPWSHLPVWQFWWAMLHPTEFRRDVCAWLIPVAPSGSLPFVQPFLKHWTVKMPSDNTVQMLVYCGWRGTSKNTVLDFSQDCIWVWKRESHQLLVKKTLLSNQNPVRAHLSSCSGHSDRCSESVFFSSLELRPQPEVPFDTAPQKLWLCALLCSAITHQLCGVANVYLIGGRTF